MKKTDVRVFADTYEGCQMVANLMGLNVETVRKRAKAGKIPARKDSTGTWVFSHHELVAAGIHPFRTLPLVPKSPAPVSKTNVTDVVFVLDRSSSMRGFSGKVRDSLMTQITTLLMSSGRGDTYSFSFVNFNGTVDVTARNVSTPTLLGQKNYVDALYLEPSGWTALYDGIDEAISISRGHDDGSHAVLISILTDGEENRSRKVTRDALSESIRMMTATDRYTFTYAGPRGSESTALSLGIPSGNITTWDQTNEGIVKLAATSHSSLASYATSRSAGVMKSTSFYAQPTTPDAGNFAGQLEQILSDVTSLVRVERVSAADPLKISDFAKAKFGDFVKGKLYYELTESEKVQDYKGIVVQDKTKGQFFSGWAAAKKLLGIPDFRGTVRIRPGSLGEFKVFVQSTSMNRRLTPGTAVVRLG